MSLKDDFDKLLEDDRVKLVLYLDPQFMSMLAAISMNYQVSAYDAIKKGLFMICSANETERTSILGRRIGHYVGTSKELTELVEGGDLWVDSRKPEEIPVDHLNFRLEYIRYLQFVLESNHIVDGYDDYYEFVDRIRGKEVKSE